MAKYKITNPYESVTDLLGNMDNHYKTNLHTHSTYSDANDTMTDMTHYIYLVSLAARIADFYSSRRRCAMTGHQNAQ